MTMMSPPRGFKPCKLVRSAKLVTTPQFAQTYKKVTGSKGRGLRYEAQVTDMLERTLDQDKWVCIPGPWFWFIDQLNRERYAQPDWLGICPSEGKIAIVEVKLTRVYKAWWQLNALYYPLVKYVFPEWDVALVEVATKVRHFELPSQVKIVNRVDTAPVEATSFVQVDYAPR